MACNGERWSCDLLPPWHVAEEGRDAEIEGGCRDRELPFVWS